MGWPVLRPSCPPPPSPFPGGWLVPGCGWWWVRLGWLAGRARIPPPPLPCCPGASSPVDSDD
eukprot:3555267-Prorocentrum_lima.AAC.1